MERDVLGNCVEDGKDVCLMIFEVDCPVPGWSVLIWHAVVSRIGGMCVKWHVSGMAWIEYFEPECHMRSARMFLLVRMSGFRGDTHIGCACGSVDRVGRETII